MPPDSALIATIAGAFVFALILGFLAAKARLPPLLGYLLAGILIGPHTPGFVADMDLAGQLADIGVMLLMFGVGLRFPAKDLRAVRGVALPGAIAQIATTTIIGATLAHFWGWPFAGSIVFGLSLSVASTVVVLKTLEQQNSLTSPEGRIAVGWLIVQDLAMVFAVLLLPTLTHSPLGTPQSGPHSLWAGLGITLLKLGLFVGVALVIGRRTVPWMLMQVARTGSRELFTLAVLATALGIAAGSAALFDVSFALGAFFAGVILSESDLSHKAGEDSLPLRDAFAVLFFVSVGMLFDPSILLREPLAVLGVLLVILLANSIAAFIVVLAFGYSVSAALTVAASLAQIGEFSFILAGLGLTLGMLTGEGLDLILAGALLSITFNPLIFAAIPTLGRALAAHESIVRRFARGGGPRIALPPDEASGLRGHAVIVGHGRVGSAITPLLEHEGLPFVVIERDRRSFEQLRDRGLPSIYGDASTRAVLQAARVGDARMLIIASPDGFQARRILELARAENPAIETFVRTHSDEEFDYLQRQGVGFALIAERELARVLSERVLRTFGIPPACARLLVRGETPAEIAENAERL